jgi:FkbM family methyltransferase
MINQIKAGLSKLMFCVNVSCSFTTFLKLVINTKRYAWSKRRTLQEPERAEAPVYYHFCLNGKMQGVWLRTYAGDIDIFYEIFWRKIYQLPLPYTKKMHTIIDLGSNIGLSALYFMNYYKPERLLCVEPEITNYNLLVQNINSGKLAKSFLPLNAAVTDLNGYTSLNTKKDFKYNISVSEEMEDGEVATFNLETLLKKFDIHQVDLIKIDIEGSEKKVFSNSEWLRHVHQLILEVHSPQDEEICLRTLQENNFTLRKIQTELSDFVFWAYRN